MRLCCYKRVLIIFVSIQVEGSLVSSPLPEIQPTSVVKVEPDEQDFSHLVQCELVVAEIPPERAITKKDELSMAQSPDEVGILLKLFS